MIHLVGPGYGATLFGARSNDFLSDERCLRYLRPFGSSIKGLTTADRRGLGCFGDIMVRNSLEKPTGQTQPQAGSRRLF